MFKWLFADYPFTSLPKSYSPCFHNKEIPDMNVRKVFWIQVWKAVPATWSWKESRPLMFSTSALSLESLKTIINLLQPVGPLGDGKTIPKICGKDPERLTIFPKEPSRNSRLFSSFFLQFSFKSQSL